MFEWLGGGWGEWKRYKKATKQMCEEHERSSSQVDTWYWKSWRHNQIIRPKTIDLRRMISDPWLKRRALRQLLVDCFTIMGPQNMDSPACGRKLSHNHNAVVHYSQKFCQLLLGSSQCLSRFEAHCTVCNLTRGFKGLMWLDKMKLQHIQCTKALCLIRKANWNATWRSARCCMAKDLDDLWPCSNCYQSVFSSRVGWNSKKGSSQKAGCT